MIIATSSSSTSSRQIRLNLVNISQWTLSSHSNPHLFYKTGSKWDSQRQMTHIGPSLPYLLMHVDYYCSSVIYLPVLHITLPHQNYFTKPNSSFSCLICSRSTIFCWCASNHIFSLSISLVSEKYFTHKQLWFARKVHTPWQQSLESFFSRIGHCKRVFCSTVLFFPRIKVMRIVPKCRFRCPYHSTIGLFFFSNYYAKLREC